MSHTFYFYDLETSGINPRESRIMQFAGQRTNEKLEPIGEPHNILIKMTPDTLPDPQAVLVTGITPQQTVDKGVTEAEFLKVFHTDIARPKTIFVGFNTVRFDDEFMRFLNFRNYYDPYQWHWADDRSRWDLLDLSRMTRALRPEGIKWPVDKDGRPTNRLELLTAVNDISHENAHDALSDVRASIAFAKLIKEKQPKLFGHLLELRDKRKVAELVESGNPFVYSSGKYPNEYLKTTVAGMVCKTQQSGGAVVFDLRHNPEKIASLSVEELVERWQHRCNERPCPHERVPLKTIKYNRCPAVAPLGVLDEASQKRIQLRMDTVKKHAKRLQQYQKQLEFNITKALQQMDKARQQSLVADEQEVDTQLYDGFISNSDKPAMREVSMADEKSIIDVRPKFSDERLDKLFPLYKARNYPATLSDEERTVWEQFCKRRLMDGGDLSRAACYFKQLGTLAEQPGLSKEKQFLLEELQLWGQSVLPLDE